MGSEIDVDENLFLKAKIYTKNTHTHKDRDMERSIKRVARRVNMLNTITNMMKTLERCSMYNDSNLEVMLNKLHAKNVKPHHIEVVSDSYRLCKKVSDITLMEFHSVIREMLIAYENSDSI